MTRRALRSTGGESVESRAYRLADVALASAFAKVSKRDRRRAFADDLREFYVAGFLAAAQDWVGE